MQSPSKCSISNSFSQIASMESLWLSITYMHGLQDRRIVAGDANLELGFVYLTVLFDYPYLVSLLFAVLLSPTSCYIFFNVFYYLWNIVLIVDLLRVLKTDKNCNPITAVTCFLYSL